MKPDSKLAFEAGTGPAEGYTLPERHTLFTDIKPCIAATFAPDANRVLLARVEGALEVSPPRVGGKVLQRARANVFGPITKEDRL